MKKRFSEAPIIGFLREAEAGLPVKQLCRRPGFSEASDDLGRNTFGGMTVSDAKRLKELIAENTRLKTLLAESVLDNEVPRGVACHHCGSTNVQTSAKHKTMPFRCRDCRKRFSVRTGTVMESSKLGFQIWAIAIYLMTTNLKGISSMKLHRELDITQKSAWHVAHRLRETLIATRGEKMVGPVEADETFVGGRSKNMHASQRERLTGRGGVDKTAVVGVKDRATGRVRAAVVERVDGPTLRGFVADNAEPSAPVYTDEATAYTGLANRESVKHGVGEYVRDQIHINGMESFWSMLKRGYVGVYHHMSPEHLDRYVGEFEGRHNARNNNTINQMAGMVRGAEGKRLRYADLVDHEHGQQAVAS